MAVAIVPTPAASAADFAVVPVDRINKFVIDDVVRGRTFTFVRRVHAIGVPRAV